MGKELKTTELHLVAVVLLIILALASKQNMTALEKFTNI